ncbi:hypothetical protein J5N97_017115 [Dioscorea zingiberensis]|uniref:Uncharacterized protein n=1 Tax=Dioscorea zingiberensis TaxID=325984 RepID=A0A9D5HG25_9LILI|nr:hypothetical protein J5N97_017115 [Dioscorea zingiberensis]
MVILKVLSAFLSRNLILTKLEVINPVITDRKGPVMVLDVCEKGSLRAFPQVLYVVFEGSLEDSRVNFVGGTLEARWPAARMEANGIKVDHTRTRFNLESMLGLVKLVLNHVEEDEGITLVEEVVDRPCERPLAALREVHHQAELLIYCHLDLSLLEGELADISRGMRPEMRFSGRESSRNSERLPMEGMSTGKKQGFDAAGGAPTRKEGRDLEVGGE